MLCKDCEYFKIIQEPIKGFDLGQAECSKFHLVTDFRDHRKFKSLSCKDRPKETKRMMTAKEALNVMRTEQACVLRNDSNQCDRDCANCDLVLPTGKVLEGYNMAIRALHALSNEYEDDGK